MVGEKLFQTNLLSRLSHKVWRLLSSPVLLRKFTIIGRRNGSENDALKMNLRSFGLYRDYSNSLTLSNVGKPSRSWISKNRIQV